MVADFIDNFDAKLHSFAREMREDANAGSAWTPFNQALNRRLFKGGKGGLAGDEAAAGDS